MNTPQARLAQEQETLLNALMAWPRASDSAAVAGLNVVHQALAERGLHAYRANAHAGAVSALQAAYPVLEQMLGEESFAQMAKAFWHRHPPLRGDWACWGVMLPEFIEGDAQLADLPWLADVARVEWDLHELATAPDAVQCPETFARLTQEDPQTLSLQLAPLRPVWASAWPVVTLCLAHLCTDASGGVDADLLTQAQAQLQRGESQDLLVWREGWRPRVREAMTGEAGFLQALQTGTPLAQALDANPELDFAVWLQTAIQTRLVLAVVPLFSQ